MPKAKAAPVSDSKKRGRPAGFKPKAKKTFKLEENFTRSIYKVLKQVHPEVGISKLGMSTMNSIMLEFYRNIAKEAQQLNGKTGKHQMTAQDI